MDQSSLSGPSDIFDYPDEPVQFGGAFHALGALTQEPARADLIGPPPPPELKPGDRVRLTTTGAAGLIAGMAGSRTALIRWGDGSVSWADAEYLECVPERTPDLADVMAAAEAFLVVERSGLAATAEDARLELERVVNAVRAASGQPPIGEPAPAPKPVCDICLTDGGWRGLVGVAPNVYGNAEQLTVCKLCLGGLGRGEITLAEHEYRQCPRPGPEGE